MARKQRLTDRPHTVLPDIDEDAGLTQAARDDPDNPPLDDDWLARARPAAEVLELARILRRHDRLGRPPLPEDARKRRVTLYLDPDVVERLKAGGRGWQTRANAALRRALGL